MQAIQLHYFMEMQKKKPLFYENSKKYYYVELNRYIILFFKTSNDMKLGPETKCTK